MTLFEMLGGAAAALTGGVGAYRAVMSKIDSVVGKKSAPDDDTLRDLVMRIDGKIDAHHANTADQISKIDKRLDLVEARIFTPPQRQAMRVAASKE